MTGERAFATVIAVALILFSAAPQSNTAPVEKIIIGYIGHPHVPPLNSYPLDEDAQNDGLDGARLGIDDNNATGRFTGQVFQLDAVIASAHGNTHAAIFGVKDNTRFIITNLPPSELIDIAKTFPAITFINAAAPDDNLRAGNCLSNVIHTIPSRAMLTDALAQYLAAKKWLRWFLVVGPSSSDQLYAAAIKRSATKFGAAILYEKHWTFRVANAHADTGHVTLQSEIPAFTRVGDYDVLIVADEDRAFGEDLANRTFLPRPIAGTQGLVATSWSPVNTQWGALQLQNRFWRKFHRHMSEHDYAAWLAVRAIGEAAVRSRNGDPAGLLNYMRGPDFFVHGFKGRSQSFRSWNGQMRQPILIAGSRVLVSASPQAGFLHQHNVLDTLGFDENESQCRH